MFCIATEPVPMRLRALPQSFWKQPNVPNPVSPAPLFPSLPPLGSKDSSEDITGEFSNVKIDIYNLLQISNVTKCKYHLASAQIKISYFFAVLYVKLIQA